MCNNLGRWLARTLEQQENKATRVFIYHFNNWIDSGGKKESANELLLLYTRHGTIHGYSNTFSLPSVLLHDKNRADRLQHPLHAGTRPRCLGSHVRGHVYHARIPRSAVMLLCHSILFSCRQWLYM